MGSRVRVPSRPQRSPTQRVGLFAFKCGAKRVLAKLMNAKSIRTEGARLLCWSTPLGSAKARQRRRQSRFLSWFAAEIHEKGRSALQGFFAGPPPLGPPRRGSATGNPVSCPCLQLRSMRKGDMQCRASLLCPPLGSAKAWQHRRQSRCLSL